LRVDAEQHLLFVEQRQQLVRVTGRDLDGRIGSVVAARKVQLVCGGFAHKNDEDSDNVRRKKQKVLPSGGPINHPTCCSVRFHTNNADYERTCLANL
jgi:hypothetical protein